MTRLSDDEIRRRLKHLSGWKLKSNTIEKEFERKDFFSAMEFIDEIRDHAKRFDHYPDIYIHRERWVRITLSTHDEQGVTDKDFVLAKLIDSFAFTENIPDLSKTRN